MKLMKKKKGFTLIELMAVIAIIAILAAVLVPTVSGYINRSKKTGIITQVRNVINAVETYNATATVSIDTTKTEIQAGDINTEGTIESQGGEDLVSAIQALVGSDLLSDDSINKLGEVELGIAIAINKDPDAVNNIEVYTNGSLKSYKYYVINSTPIEQ